MHTIRAFEKTESEYLTLAGLLSEDLENLTLIAAGFKHCDAMQNHETYQRLVAEIDSQIVAYSSRGQSIWHPSPRVFDIVIEVDPEFQGQGIGSDLYNRLIADLEEHNPTTLKARARENDPHGIQFLRKRGFQQKSSEPLFALDLLTFENSAYDSIPGEMKSLGIDFVSLAELRLRDPDWLRKWWHLEWQILQDIPTDEPPERRSLEQFEVDVQHPAIIPEAFFFAVDSGKLVGISGLTRQDEKTTQADLTWVIPSHQGKNIELALKLKTIASAIQKGAVYLLDDTFEGDPGYQLNLELGFQHLPPWLVFEKVF